MTDIEAIRENIRANDLAGIRERWATVTGGIAGNDIRWLLAEVERLNKARLCQQHYDGPNDEDYGSADCIICLMNRCDRLTAQRAAALAIHKKGQRGTLFYCSGEVSALWPCPTARALGVES